MHSISRHVQIQRQKRQAQENACKLLVGTVMAVTTGRWTIDKSCDPAPTCEKLQIALMNQHMIAIVNLMQDLAQTISVAVRAGDFTPYHENDDETVRLAEEIYETMLENEMKIAGESE